MSHWLYAQFDFTAWLICLAAVALFATGGWLLSLRLHDVSIVDSMWPLIFLLVFVVYVLSAEHQGWRALAVGVMLSLWSLRLAIYLTWRNHGQPEDRRYRAIRRNNQPNFEFKSLFIIFLFQGLLAWVICLPILAAVTEQAAPGPQSVLIFCVGVALWFAGLLMQTIADAQLHHFLKRRENSDAVLDTGLWRYSRHPNYFGEFLIWWGFFLLALSAGGAWTMVSPLLMTILLLRVSGVALLEADIAGRRPAYRQYIRQTNAFFPGPRHQNIEEASLT
jgi:steroid 5-alpha reductase family enzyme